MDQINQSPLVADILQEFDPFEPLLLADDAALLKPLEQGGFFLDFALLAAYPLEFAHIIVALCLCRHPLMLRRPGRPVGKKHNRSTHDDHQQTDKQADLQFFEVTGQEFHDPIFRLICTEKERGLLSSTIVSSPLSALPDSTSNGRLRMST